MLQSLFDKVEPSPNDPNFTIYEGKVNPSVLSARDLRSRPVELNIEHINSSTVQQFLSTKTTNLDLDLLSARFGAGDLWEWCRCD